MKILLKTAGTILIEMDGRPELLPNNDYTQLRFMRFDGGRIHHDFGDGCIIQETYNRGIYNCECDGELIQIYDGGQVARAILDDDIEAYRTVFSEWYGERTEHEVVGAVIREFGDRVKRGKLGKGVDGYIVDDLWGVRTDGGAMYYHNNMWHHICLVASRTEDREIVLNGHTKPVKVSARTWVVMAKIMFLLHPRPERVFMGQLPGPLKRLVMASQDGLTEPIPMHPDWQH